MKTMINVFAMATREGTSVQLLLMSHSPVDAIVVSSSIRLVQRLNPSVVLFRMNRGSVLRISPDPATSDIVIGRDANNHVKLPNMDVQYPMTPFTTPMLANTSANGEPLLYSMEPEHILPAGHRMEVASNVVVHLPLADNGLSPGLLVVCAYDAAEPLESISKWHDIPLDLPLQEAHNDVKDTSHYEDPRDVQDTRHRGPDLMQTDYIEPARTPPNDATETAQVIGSAAESPTHSTYGPREKYGRLGRSRFVEPDERPTSSSVPGPSRAPTRGVYQRRQQRGKGRAADSDSEPATVYSDDADEDEREDDNSADESVTEASPRKRRERRTERSSGNTGKQGIQSALEAGQELLQGLSGGPGFRITGAIDGVGHVDVEIMPIRKGAKRKHAEV
ncbi:hypothetical protein SUNI508_01171 [Seiridium unicorne]|uniref:Uncharacterized protein n=1 Tax=Seiridium unicorne TaxID=138068 RepID=A0ABR2UWX1_9PEZI